MAKAEQTKKKKTNAPSFFSRFNDERVGLISSILIFFFSLFMLFALISYFFTWKTDASFIWQNVFSGADTQVSNWAGKAGAQIASFFIHGLFGIPSLAIPLLLIIVSMYIVNLRFVPLFRLVTLTLISLILLSIILGYLFGSAGGYLGAGPGGSHGIFISNWLNALLGKAGTAMLLLIATFTFIIISFPAAYNWLKKQFTSTPATAVEPGEENSDIGDTEATGNYPDDTDLVFVTKKAGDDATEIPDHTTVSPTAEEEIDITVMPPADEELTETTLPEAPEGDYDPTLDLSSYRLPPIDLLEKHEIGNLEVGDEELIRNKNKIVETLKNYKIDITRITATIGPTVTLYEIVPAPGVRIAKIKNLEDDIALSLAALGIRIIAPMPGKGTIGIEVPNQNPQIVPIRAIIGSKKFQESKHELSIGIGKTISNETYVFDLTKMPHLLIAGTTGQGKSVGLNCIVASLLYKKHPSEIKFVMIDPKKVELTPYTKLYHHFIAQLPDSNEPIITDMSKVVNTLKSLCIEMENRYDLLTKAGARNLSDYNAKFISRKLNPNNGHKFLPYIVVIIDEFADLIQQEGKEIELPLNRLAQKARAIGIHLIIATQRPSTDIITGLIKANFPARIAFRVPSMIDSKTIIDRPGANQLIGRGDMLFSSGSELIRLQCALIETPEIERICEFINEQQAYPTPFLLPEVHDETPELTEELDNNRKDDLFEDAARLVVQHQQGSTSLLQRKFAIGYNRAGRIMDQLEKAAIVGKFEGSKARAVNYTDLDSLEKHLISLRAIETN